MRFYFSYKHSVILIVMIMFILSLQACNSKNENPLLGQWVSDDILQRSIDPNYKETHLKFGSNYMHIDEKEIPVIYKIKKNKVILFSRGEKVVAHIVSEDKIILFLRKIGKKIYIRKP